jgi:hypothetical protein
MKPCSVSLRHSVSDAVQPVRDLLERRAAQVIDDAGGMSLRSGGLAERCRRCLVGWRPMPMEIRTAELVVVQMRVRAQAIESAAVGAKNLARFHDVEKNAWMLEDDRIARARTGERQVICGDLDHPCRGLRWPGHQLFDISVRLWFA